MLRISSKSSIACPTCSRQEDFLGAALEIERYEGSSWGVNELIETTRTKEGRVKLVRSVSSTNHEDILLGLHTVHSSEHLIENTIACTSDVAE